MEIPLPSNGIILPHEMSLGCAKNPLIMRIVKDSFGSMNEKYKSNFGQANNSIQKTMFEVQNGHYMLVGDQFLPVPTDISMQNWNVDKIDGISNVPARKDFPKRFSKQPHYKFKNTNTSTLNILPPPIPLNFAECKSNNQVLPVPKHTKSIKESTNVENNKFSKEMENTRDSKKTQTKSLYCTGSIERILRWNRNLTNTCCIYETIAPVISIQEGRIHSQKIMLLRDMKGPILQVQYYTTTRIDINEFCLGQYLRCVGRMRGYNILLADSIREAKQEEISTLSRLSYVSDFSVSNISN